MSNNTLTINKLKSIFEDIANRHWMINDYGFGPSYNIGNDKPMNFPYLWIEPVNTRVHSVNGQSGPVEYYTFNMYVMDKINKGDDNYIDTSSDCDYISKTILTQLEQHVYFQDLDLSFEGDATGECVYEQTEDNANGWVTNFTLKLPLRYTPCNEPFTPIYGYTVSLPTPGSNVFQISYIGPAGPTGADGATGPQGATGIGGSQSLFQTLTNGNSTGGLAITSPNTFNNLIIDDNGNTLYYFDGNSESTIGQNNQNAIIGHSNNFLTSMVFDGVNGTVDMTGKFNQQSSLFTPGTYIKSDGYSGELTYFNAAMGALFNGIKTDSAQVWLNYESTTAIQSSGRIQLNDSNSLLQHDAQVSITSPLTYILGAFTQQQYPGGGGDGTTIYSDGSQVALRTETTSGQHNLIIAESGNGVALQVTDNLGTLTNTFQMTNAGIYIPNNGTNSTFYIDDKLERKGLVYYDDYSANFTPESLVSKRYVDTTAGNIGNSYVLKNYTTSIAGVNRTTGVNRDVLGNFDISLNYYDNGSNIGELFNIGFNDSDLTLSAYSFNTAYETSIRLEVDSINVSSSDTTFKGIEYSSDYSANFTTYSLVTKGYVDSLTPIPPTLSSVLSVGNNAGTYSVNMNLNKVISVATGSNSLDAVNLSQMNTSILAMSYVISNGLVKY